MKCHANPTIANKLIDKRSTCAATGPRSRRRASSRLRSSSSTVTKRSCDIAGSSSSASATPDSDADESTETAVAAGRVGPCFPVIGGRRGGGLSAGSATRVGALGSYSSSADSPGSGSVFAAEKPPDNSATAGSGLPPLVCLPSDNPCSIADNCRASRSAFVARSVAFFESNRAMMRCNSRGTSCAKRDTAGGSASRCICSISGIDLPRNGGRPANIANITQPKLYKSA